MDMQNVSNLVISEGEVRTIHDENNRLLWGRVSYDVKYNGNTLQNGTPSPDAPVAVQVATGEQTVTLSDGVASEDYTVNLGSLELCKIGTYQDYIYKSGDDWYVHKETRKVVLDGTETWSASNNGFLRAYNSLSPFYNLIALGEPSYQSVCDHFVVQPNGTTWTGRGKCGFNSSGAFWVLHTDTSITTAQQFKNWLASNNTAIYIPIAASTEAQITDTALISQLEMVHQFATRYGYNANGTSSVPIIISRSDL